MLCKVFKVKKHIIALFVTITGMLCGCSDSEPLNNFAQAISVSTKNNNYHYTEQDAVNLQNFLLGKNVSENLNGKPYDMNNDGTWNVFDLCLLRSKLNPVNNDNDTIVVYFSRTNNTEKIANYIIDYTDSDSYEIEATVPYSDADIAYNNSSCRANQEQNDKTARPEIANPIESLDSYDVIYLGYPIWWGEEPRIIDTFLESYDFSDKTVIPFCTSASSGITTSEKNISNLVDIGNQLEGKRFSASTSQSEVEQWIDGLNIKTNAEEKIYLTINDTKISASLENNSSAQALKEKLSEGDVIINAHN